MQVSSNFIEIPMGLLISLVTQFIHVFTPEDVLKLKVLFLQSGDSLHVYTRSDEKQRRETQ